MKKYVITAAATLLMAAFTAPTALNVRKEVTDAGRQLVLADQARKGTDRIPHSTKPDGSANDRETSWWTSGFFPGNLWYVYEYTKDPKYRKLAEKWTAPLEKEQYNTRTHDLGFMLYCSYGNGYRLTKNPKYRDIMIQGANSLASRFDPKVGVIKSWDKFGTYNYPVIIDNMMNLEFLFWASKATGDPSFRKIAVTHADNTMKNHFRADNSSFHVVCYNPDGSVAAQKTHQGAADESAWARGQAWGLYGYTVMYRETKDKRYLTQAQKIADYFLSHSNLPEDKIPYWDFNRPNEERDASAGAITASALLELSQYSKAKQKTYVQAAEKMLQSLSSASYKAKLGDNNQFVLQHSVGHKPGKSEIDVPLVYADYYFIEGLMRYEKVKAGKRLFI
ncbi:glycoside hydrolase family 88 protein [Tellurirhabdus bombi]|uniref:glycoside hydrolase family 88 protein n=1 Tax=Tellurirhabdus bombi TaxID=2907205 RepID=UPI001F2BD44B|nr:glycoside hydrolase family 88 protein [Tellurirhabdus bombi]